MRTRPARSGVDGSGDDPHPRPETRMVERHVPPEASADSAEKADAALRPVAGGGHQPDCIVIGGEFLPSLSATEAENAARCRLRVAEAVVRHLVSDHEREFVVAAGKPHHAGRYDHTAAIRPSVAAVRANKRRFPSAPWFPCQSCSDQSAASPHQDVSRSAREGGLKNIGEGFHTPV
jgi:hypothetical protein